jgi:hypothetical protein
MSTALRRLWIGCLVGLPFFADADLAAGAADSAAARSEATGLSPHGIQLIEGRAVPNAATPSVAPAPPAPDKTAANATSITYRSYSPDPARGAQPGSYYYYDPAACRWYYAVPVQGPGATVGPAAPGPAQAGPSTAVANSDSSTYRAYSPEPGASAPYLYYSPGAYRYSSSSGHSWSGRR